MERSPWFSTRTSHASPGDGDGTFKPYYTVDDGAWDRHAATFSNAIRMRDIGICAVVSRVCAPENKLWLV